MKKPQFGFSVFILFTSVLASGATASSISTSNTSCDNVVQKALRALKQADEPVLRQHTKLSTYCDDGVANTVSDYLSKHLWRKARHLQKNGGSDAEIELILTELVQYGDIWQAHDWLGNIRSAAKNYVQATQSFQHAIDTISDENKTPRKPSDDDIQKLVAKAQNMQFLAEEYVPVTTTRSGEPSGLASDNVRGVIFRKRDIPITFRFNSTEFTDKGHAAAKDLVRELTFKKPQSLTLIGHTDSVGDASYNLQLSHKRALAVKSYLQKHLRDAGLSPLIYAEGKGESDLAARFDNQLSEKDYQQRCRRVELKIND